MFSSSMLRLWGRLRRKLCTLALWLLLIPTAAQGAALAVAQELPTPTPPALTRPNLHLYFKDLSALPLGGLALTVYRWTFDQPSGKYLLEKKFEGKTNAVEGRADFDAASALYGLFYLEVKEADGTTLVLNTDPNGPSVNTGAPPDPQVKLLTPLPLFEGGVVYVFSYEVRLLVKPIENSPARRAIYVPATQKWLYYPNNPDGLGLGGGTPPNGSGTPGNRNGPVASPTPTIAINKPTPTLSATATASNPIANSTAAATPVAGAAAGTGASQEAGTLYPPLNPDGANVASPSPPLPQANNGTVTTGGGATAIAPTPTALVECRNCVPTAIGGSGGYPGLTAQAATVRAELTAGTYQHGDPSGGFRGRDSSPIPGTSGGRGSTSPQKTTSPNSGALQLTPASTSGNGGVVASADGAKSTTPGNGNKASANGQAQANSPGGSEADPGGLGWPLLLGLVGLLVLFGIGGFALLKLKR